jgi:LmbE family N-acetylglucosaminyl deacetylase
MKLVVDETHRGPSEAEWISSIASASIPTLQTIRERRVVIIAPHPDDEVLGAGGLIQKALRDRHPIEVIAVTDGEASHPQSETFAPTCIGALRAHESDEALRRLGWLRPVVTRLHLPDGGVGARRDELFAALVDMLLPDDLCVAPWHCDGHPDHDATGEAALRACREVGATLMSYLVWAWHWADPLGADIPWDRCRRLDLGRRARARKRWSTLAFRSQVRPIGPTSVDAAILPEHVLRRFWRPYEVYVEAGAHVS